MNSTVGIHRHSLRPAARLALMLVVATSLASCARPEGQPPLAVGTPALPPTASVMPTAPAQVAVSYGVHVRLDSVDPAPILNGVAAMRFEWIALTIAWRGVEPHEGQYDWTAPDAAMQAVAASGFGVRVLAVVKGTPDWARPSGADLTRDGPPADLTKFGNFVRALVGRYAGRIAAYEIYPNPNDARYWSSPAGLSAQEYAAVLQTGWSAVRAADPLAIVVSGGLSPTGANDGVNGIASTQYLAELYAAGAAQWTDAVGVHLDGYNNPPTDSPDLTTVSNTGFKGEWPYYFRQYERLHDQMIAQGDTQHPLWLTSVGWASQTPAPEGLPYAADNTEEQQANYLVAAAYQVRQHPYIQVMIIDNFNYSVVEGGNTRGSAYSLIRSDWSARPAFLALARMRQADALPTPGASATGWADGLWGSR